MANDDIRPALLDLLQIYQARCGTNLKGAIRDLIAELAAIGSEGNIDPVEIVQQGLAIFDEESSEGD